MSKMTICLWFDHGKAREAAEFYASVFPDSHVGERRDERPGSRRREARDGNNDDDEEDRHRHDRGRAPGRMPMSKITGGVAPVSSRCG